MFIELCFYLVESLFHSIKTLFYSVQAFKNSSDILPLCSYDSQHNGSIFFYFLGACSGFFAKGGKGLLYTLCFPVGFSSGFTGYFVCCACSM